MRLPARRAAVYGSAGKGKRLHRTCRHTDDKQTDIQSREILVGVTIQKTHAMEAAGRSTDRKCQSTTENRLLTNRG